MKKIILAAAMTVLAAPAFAATAVCDGTTAHDATVTAGTDFILNDFTQKCSTNVFLQYAENATVAAVGSASKKGKNVFAGSTAGGAVAPVSSAVSETGFADGGAAGTQADAVLAAASSS